MSSTVIRRVLGLTLLLVATPRPAWAQREIHWQVDPAGFPSRVSVFVDVEERGIFRRDLSAADFSVSVDEHVGDQGGRILRPDRVKVGDPGALVLLLVDRSRTYTRELSLAKSAMRDLVARLDPTRDQVAIVSTPSSSGYADTVVERPFTSDLRGLQKTIDGLTPLGSADAPRVCQALAEAVRAFPEERGGRFRAIVFFSAGLDRGEGRGGCVERSHGAGKVPFFTITYTPDHRYRDDRSEHRIENALDELASRTGGRSIFRRDSSEVFAFVSKLASRLRSQYRLEVELPCYRPAPTTEHLAVLKVQGRDAEGLRFEAPSALAPRPQVTSLQPSGAPRHAVDDGDVVLTIEGRGFCGGHGAVKVQIGDRSTPVTSQSPYELVTKLHPSTETGVVKVINQYGEASESDLQFKVRDPDPGEDASATLTVLVVVIVCMVVIGVLTFALRRRRAAIDRAPKGTPRPSRREGKPPAPALAGVHAAETVRTSPIRRAWVELSDGRRLKLEDGDNLIGREASCKVCLDLPGISREHARIDLSAVHGVAWLEDLGSRNGTFLGRAGTSAAEAERLGERRMLDSGDVIVVGGERITVFFER